MTDPSIIDPNCNCLYPFALEMENQLKLNKPRIISYAELTRNIAVRNPYWGRFKIIEGAKFDKEMKRLFVD